MERERGGILDFWFRQAGEAGEAEGAGEAGGAGSQFRIGKIKS
jgi:hypothetical protein